jgi:hypothetical protein
MWQGVTLNPCYGDRLVRIGKCKLCHLENQDLCDSHYLPKKIYGVTRAPQLKSPHPVTLSGTSMRQLSDQLRDYVFCKCCEQRLNKNGEQWVLANIPDDCDGAFPLRAALQALTPIFVGTDLDLYDVTNVPTFEIDKLLYFAVSVFWRGAVHDWETTGGLKAPKVELCGYEEPIRGFLMGEQILPLGVVLTADIWHAKKVFQAAYPPLASHLPECQRYWFYIPGIIFSLYLGDGIPADIHLRDTKRNVLGVDVPAINSIWAMARSQVQSREVSPKMKLMFDEIAAIRSKQGSTG